MSTSIFWTSLIGLQANINSAVTAEGQFPAPLITGKKGDRFLVGLFFHERVVHADYFVQIDVTDKLTDSSMRRATSLVCLGS